MASRQALEGGDSGGGGRDQIEKGGEKEKMEVGQGEGDGVPMKRDRDGAGGCLRLNKSKAVGHWVGLRQ